MTLLLITNAQLLLIVIAIALVTVLTVARIVNSAKSHMRELADKTNQDYKVTVDCHNQVKEWYQGAVNLDIEMRKWFGDTHGNNERLHTKMLDTAKGFHEAFSNAMNDPILKDFTKAYDSVKLYQEQGIITPELYRVAKQITNKSESQKKRKVKLEVINSAGEQLTANGGAGINITFEDRSSNEVIHSSDFHEDPEPKGRLDDTEDHH